MGTGQGGRRGRGASRTAPAEESPTARAIFSAAVDLFYRHGYEAATLRDIAKKVGLKVGSLYNHMASKQELLFNVMHGVMEDLLADAEAAVAARETPVERLRAAIDVHVRFHALRQKEVFVGNRELRSLTPANRTKVVGLRDRYERLHLQIIEEGRRAGVFHVDDAKVAAYGILAMCTGVSSWYSPRGRLSVKELVDIYSAMALRTLGAPEAAVAPYSRESQGASAP